MPTLEDITRAADTLDALLDEGANKEASPHHGTHWFATSRQLRALAEARKPKPAKVYVSKQDQLGQDEAFYIEKPNGDYIAVYVGTDYHAGYSINAYYPGTPSRTLIHGGEE